MNERGINDKTINDLANFYSAFIVYAFLEDESNTYQDKIRLRELWATEGTVTAAKYISKKHAMSESGIALRKFCGNF